MSPKFCRVGMPLAPLRPSAPRQRQVPKHRFVPSFGPFLGAAGRPMVRHHRRLAYMAQRSPWLILSESGASAKCCPRGCSSSSSMGRRARPGPWFASSIQCDCDLIQGVVFALRDPAPQRRPWSRSTWSESSRRSLAWPGFIKVQRACQFSTADPSVQSGLPARFRLAAEEIRKLHRRWLVHRCTVSRRKSTNRASASSRTLGPTVVPTAYCGSRRRAWSAPIPPV